MVEADPAVRATTLELFFDLVFVFAITQLTSVLVQDMSWRSFAQIFLMFSVLWWMYDGYVWLTNAVSPNRADRRALLMIGMVGFMVIALAIPETFDGSGVAFGLGYVLVILAHFLLYRQCGVATTRGALPRLLAVNMGAAGLVLLGGWLGGAWSYTPWLAAILLLVMSPYLVPPGNFRIQSAHFVERHGLVVIVALGESIIAVGIGARELGLDAALVGLVVLGLTLSFALWWLYFGQDDSRAEAVLAATEPGIRPMKSLQAFYYAHIPLLIGIIVMAAGVEDAIAHAGEAVEARSALALGGGVALFLAAQGCFRLVLGLSGAAPRFVAAAAALGTAALGDMVLPAAQLVLLVAVLALAALSDRAFRLKGPLRR